MTQSLVCGCVSSNGMLPCLHGVLLVRPGPGYNPCMCTVPLFRAVRASEVWLVCCRCTVCFARLCMLGVRFPLMHAWGGNALLNGNPMPIHGFTSLPGPVLQAGCKLQGLECGLGMAVPTLQGDVLLLASIGLGISY